MKTKKEFREIVRKLKGNITSEELHNRSATIVSRIESLARFRSARSVAAYWSLPDEVQTHAFIERWSAEKIILLPVMCNGNNLELRKYQKGCVMNEAEFCIRQPEGELFSPSETDLILVPGVAFDSLNHRIGRGKGYYDRLLKDFTGYKIGMCFDFQYFHEIPFDSHDVSVDEVIYG